MLKIKLVLFFLCLNFIVLMKTIIAIYLLQLVKLHALFVKIYMRVIKMTVLFAWNQ
jgi:hypothetical protein